MKVTSEIPYGHLEHFANGAGWWYYRGVPMDDPPNVKDRRHRHVLVW